MSCGSDMRTGLDFGESEAVTVVIEIIQDVCRISAQLL